MWTSLVLLGRKSFWNLGDFLPRRSRRNAEMDGKMLGPRIDADDTGLGRRERVSRGGAEDAERAVGDLSLEPRRHEGREGGGNVACWTSWCPLRLCGWRALSVVATRELASAVFLLLRPHRHPARLARGALALWKTCRLPYANRLPQMTCVFHRQLLYSRTAFHSALDK